MSFLNDPAAPDGRRRLAAVIGAMRCGTTSFFEYLAQHPEICPCSDKEPDFFSNDQRFAGGLAAYEQLFPPPKPGQVLLDASVNYSKQSLFPHAAERIARSPFDVRLIYLLRNPLRRTESHHTLAAAKGWRESQHSLDEDLHPDLLEPSRYAKQIRAHLAHHPREHLLLVRTEELVADGPRVMRDVARFLGIDDSFAFRDLDRVHNSNVGRRPGDPGQRLYRMRQKLPFWGLVVRFLPRRTKDRIRALFASKSGRAPVLSAQAERRILEALEPDLAALERDFGFDVAAWKLPGRPSGSH